MIYYNFIGDGELIATNTTLGVIDGIIFYDIQDIIGAINDIPLPDANEAVLINQLDFTNAIYLRLGILIDSTSMTQLQLDNGLLLRKLLKKLKLKKYYDVSIKGAFSSLDTERETWERQKIEADAYILDVNAGTPFLDALSTSRGITKADVVQKILAKAEIYAIAIGNLLGEQYKFEDQLELVSTLAELDALVLPDFCTLDLDFAVPEVSSDLEPEPEPEA